MIIVKVIILIAFFFNSLGVMPAKAEEFVLPKPGVMVHLSPPMNLPVLKGIKVHKDNPFKFDFVLDQGDKTSREAQRAGGDYLKQESTKLIKYFLATLTIPEKDLWVNLSPYEKNRIIPESFGLTEMGRDLLAEDYMLKQITASLIYPEDEVGKKFWKRVYEEAQAKYHTTNIPVNTFNKVWIVPAKAVVYENAKMGTAFVVESSLKVLLEADYLAIEKNASKSILRSSTQKPLSEAGLPQNRSLASARDDAQQIGTDVVRQIVIPELTREVNEGKNFAQLRQVYNSLILAAWYKKKIKDSILSRVYSDKSKVVGVNIDNPQETKKIYERYLQAFKKGVYNYIKEEPDPVTHENIPRKYFSGGANFNAGALKLDIKDGVSLPAGADNGNLAVISSEERPASAAMSIEERIKDMKILYVEDDPGLRAAWEGFFKEDFSYKNVTVVGTYAEAEALLKEHKFDLVVSDHNLVEPKDDPQRKWTASNLAKQDYAKDTDFIIYSGIPEEVLNLPNIKRVFNKSAMGIVDFFDYIEATLKEKLSRNETEQYKALSAYINNLHLIYHYDSYMSTVHIIAKIVDPSHPSPEDMVLSEESLHLFLEKFKANNQVLREAIASNPEQLPLVERLEQVLRGEQNVARINIKEGTPEADRFLLEKLIGWIELHDPRSSLFLNDDIADSLGLSLDIAKRLLMHIEGVRYKEFNEVLTNEFLASHSVDVNTFSYIVAMQYLDHKLNFMLLQRQPVSAAMGGQKDVGVKRNREDIGAQLEQREGLVEERLGVSKQKISDFDLYGQGMFEFLGSGRDLNEKGKDELKQSIENNKIIKIIFNGMNAGYFKDLNARLYYFSDFISTLFNQFNRRDVADSIYEALKNAFAHGNLLKAKYPVYLKVNIEDKSVEIYDLNLASLGLKADREDLIGAYEVLFGLNMGRKVIESSGFKYEREDIKQKGRVIGTVVRLKLKTSNQDMAPENQSDQNAAQLSEENLKEKIKAGEDITLSSLGITILDSKPPRLNEKKIMDQIRKLPPGSLVLVAGESGAGKSSLFGVLQEEGFDIVFLNLDSYFKDGIEHPLFEDQTFNHEHPNALKIDLVIKHIQKIIKGKMIRSPRYDWSEGGKSRPGQGKRIKMMKKTLLFVEGLHAMDERIVQAAEKAIEQANESSKVKENKFVKREVLKIYLTAPEIERFRRRYDRDINRRNAAAKEIIDYWPTVLREEAKLIKPKMKETDAIFHSYGEFHGSALQRLFELKIKISLLALDEELRKAGMKQEDMIQKKLDLVLAWQKALMATMEPLYEKNDEMIIRDLKKRDIKAVFLDLDGTLAFYGQSLSAEMLGKLDRLARRGIRIIIVTDDTEDHVDKRLMDHIDPKLKYMFDEGPDGGSRALTWDENGQKKYDVYKEYSDRGFISRDNGFAQRETNNEGFRLLIKNIFDEKLKKYRGYFEFKESDKVNASYILNYKLKGEYQELKEKKRVSITKDTVVDLNVILEKNNLKAKAYWVSDSKSVRVVLQHKEDLVRYLKRRLDIPEDNMAIGGDSVKPSFNDHEFEKDFPGAFCFNVGRYSRGAAREAPHIYQFLTMSGMEATGKVLSVILGEDREANGASAAMAADQSEHKVVTQISDQDTSAIEEGNPAMAQVNVSFKVKPSTNRYELEIISDKVLDKIRTALVTSEKASEGLSSLGFEFRRNGLVDPNNRLDRVSLMEAVNNAIDAIADEAQRQGRVYSGQILFRMMTGPQGKIIFELEDNGIGMDSDLLSRAFRKVVKAPRFRTVSTKRGWVSLFTLKQRRLGQAGVGLTYYGGTSLGIRKGSLQIETRSSTSQESYSLSLDYSSGAAFTKEVTTGRRKKIGTTLKWTFHSVSTLSSGNNSLLSTSSLVGTSIDHSRATSAEGGIDFNTSKMDLQLQNAGEGIKFDLNPAMLAQLQNAPGFMPIIIDIQPMRDLPGFLGMSEAPSKTKLATV